MKCMVCGGNVNGIRCERCGFAMVVALDEEGERALLKRAEHHKKRFISRIKNISIKTFDVGGKEEKVFLCNGEDCYLKKVESKPYPVNPAGITVERCLHLSLEIDGVEREYRVLLSPDASLPYWQVAVRLDEDLKLTVMAGAQQTRDFGVVEL